MGEVRQVWTPCILLVDRLDRSSGIQARGVSGSARYGTPRRAALIDTPAQILNARGGISPDQHHDQPGCRVGRLDVCANPAPGRAEPTVAAQQGKATIAQLHLSGRGMSSPIH